MNRQLIEDRMIISHQNELPQASLGAVVPPIYMNSLHVFDNVESYGQYDSVEDGTYIYGRDGNPTVETVEAKLAGLERGERALLFGSGMAALSTAVMAVCRANSHIICMNNVYGPLKQFINNYCIPRLNMSVTYVKGSSIEEFAAAVTSATAMILVESPSTFIFSLTNLRELSQLARKHNIKTMIDNTYCTPLFQKPLEMGIDIVMHTVSKYLGGHSDVIGGVLVSKDITFMNEMKSTIRQWFGGIAAPMEAWLVLRGIRTLELRLLRHEETATQVAEYLEQHSRVQKVNYPGLKSHPQYELMQSQQTGNSGLLSLELDGDLAQAKKFVEALNIFQIGCSWGGFESLALIPLYNESPESVELIGCQRSLIRLHCGLEGAEHLLSDIEQALAVL